MSSSANAAQDRTSSQHGGKPERGEYRDARESQPVRPVRSNGDAISPGRQH
ncbi:hypothetical protein AOX55_00005254 (plasmid) [Sinorhizobium fredii CCBAU 25509]|nr:hypothetical protein AOX55_00005254 [Sinorhizobium fredii CCBAU 25509]